MKRSDSSSTFVAFFAAALICLAAHSQAVRAQQQEPTPKPTPSDDVVRVSTSLVQTDVMVFDKQGQFVDGLKPEQFELKVDGKVKPVAFFERVAAGSASESAQLAAAARGGGSGGEARSTTVSTTADAQSTPRGRTIMFFVDDLHLATDSLVRTRRMLQRFIDTEMLPNDQASVSSTSDQIGFLQQLTGDKAMLKAAVERLTNRSRSVGDLGSPPMNEYQALAISRGERDVFDYFVEQVLKRTPEFQRIGAEEEVRTRAQRLVEQSVVINTNTLIAFDNFTRTAARLPGRKLVFFVSDGFFLESQNSSLHDRLRRITEAASRAGVVIYSMDARGLVTGMPDASEDVAADTSGRLSRASIGSIAGGQDVLTALALDTGGRALLNNNDLSAGVQKALKETSVYYLLAWRPDDDAMQAGGKPRRIEISITGRPDLKVRMRRGFTEAASLVATGGGAVAGSTSATNAAAAVDEALKKALTGAVPSSALPTSLVLTYTDAPGSGPALIVSAQMSSAALAFEDVGGKQTASVDLLGVVLDKQGKEISNFRKRLSLDPASNVVDPAHKLIFYNHQTNIAPGLYQVRVAAREAKSGSVGSATQWIEVPDVRSGRLALSSLLLVEHADEAVPAQGVKRGVTQRFARNSRLRFMTYVYNAAYDKTLSDEPDVTIHVQVLRGTQPIVDIPSQEVPPEGVEDFARLPYAGEVPLEGLPPGEYTLQVNVTDRTAKTNATQRATFIIE